MPDSDLTGPPPLQPGRLRFANQLRGVAALAVMCSHLIGVFWVMRDFAGAATATPVQGGANPGLVALVSHPWFNLGPFGVGVFFLVSGLVIPFSLERHTRSTFLLARLLRVYPTYVAAVSIEVAVIAANAAYWHRPFPHDAWTVLSNLLLIQDLVGRPSIDLVNWTLCIELRFYLVVALASNLIRGGRGLGILVLGLCAAGLVPVAATGVFGPVGPEPTLLSYSVSTGALFIVFMLIGVLFNFHVRCCISTTALGLGGAMLMLLFTLAWRVSALDYQYPGVLLNYYCALLVFSLMYFVRSHVPRVRLLDALAAISFPLYLVHSLVGYSVLKVLLVVWEVDLALALPVTIGCVVGLASGLHVTIERASIGWGRALARRKAPVVHSGVTRMSAPS